MIIKNTVISTGVDLQGDYITLEAVEDFARLINQPASTIRFGIEHDRTILPIGKVLNGELVDKEDGKIALEVTIDNFMDDFQKYTTTEGEILYVGKSSIDKRPFYETILPVTNKLCIELNIDNFNDDVYSKLKSYLEEECSITIETSIKKSLIPDPEIVINFLPDMMFYLIATKSCWKLSGKVSSDFVNLYTVLRKTVLEIACSIKTYTKTTYVFTEANQPFELVIQTDKAENVFQALDKLEESKLVELVDKYSDCIEDELSKVQFIYNDELGKWEFNYCTTKTGQSIGTEKCYKKAVKMYTRIAQESTAGLSIGGTATIREEQPNV